jgi:hypothetical protein
MYVSVMTQSLTTKGELLGWKAEFKG